jgi:hypothetical protein
MMILRRGLPGLALLMSGKGTMDLTHLVLKRFSAVKVTWTWYFPGEDNHLGTFG